MVFSILNQSKELITGLKFYNFIFPIVASTRRPHLVAGPHTNPSTHNLYAPQTFNSCLVQGFSALVCPETMPSSLLGWVNQLYTAYARDQECCGRCSLQTIFCSKACFGTCLCPYSVFSGVSEALRHASACSFQSGFLLLRFPPFLRPPADLSLSLRDELFSLPQPALGSLPRILLALWLLFRIFFAL